MVRSHTSYLGILQHGLLAVKYYVQILEIMFTLHYVEYWSSVSMGMFTRDCGTIPVMSESLCKDWHMTSSQGSEQCNTARLLPTYHTVYTITIHDVTSWHTDRTPTTVLVTSYIWENTLVSNSIIWHDVATTVIKISTLVAHWHSDSCTSCSHLISNYSTVLVQK